MGAGTLTANSIVLGQLTGSTNAAATTPAGLLSVAGGTVSVATLTLGDKTVNNTSAVAATFSLSAGATLAAGEIKAGSSAGTGTITRTFEWNDGTIKNRDTSTDLTIGTGLVLTMSNTGAHRFDIGAGRTGTVHAALAESAAGAVLTKQGAGTLVLAGDAYHTGGTIVSAGTLDVRGAIVVANTDAIAVASGASLAIPGTLKLMSTSATLANDGTIAIQSGILDLGGLFDAYSGQYVLITGSGTKSGTFAAITGYAGSQVVTYDNGILTFGAIPEPSTYGLLGAGALATAAVVRRRRRIG